MEGTKKTAMTRGTEQRSETEKKHIGPVTSVAYNDPPAFDHRADRLSANAQQVDRRPVDDHRIHLLADLEAADAVVAVERVRAVDRRGDERLLERHLHGET